MSSNFPKAIGNYRLLEVVGIGGFGIVYRAEHIYLPDRMAAVKLLHTRPSSEENREHLLREVKILGKLRHPHILPIFDAGIEKDTPYIITKLALGGSLRKLLGQAPQLLPLEDTIRILTQVAEALQAAHQKKIVHRDLKPENILLDANGNVLLADFGLAKILSMSVQQVSFGGTLAYMAPEQLKKDESLVSIWSDQYALGCIAYELVMGKLPLKEDLPDPRDINPFLPKHVSQAILKALAKEHKQRHPDVMSFIQALTKTKAQQHSETLKYPSLTPHEVLGQTLDPTSPEAYTKRGTAFYKLKRYDEALAAFDQALRLDPQFAIGYNNKGNALYELKRYDEALDAFNKALHLNSQFVKAYNGKGNALYKLKRYSDALVAYDQALRLNPQFVKAYNGKGNALYELKRYEQALTAYD